MNRLMTELKKRKEMILYLFFGAVTTLVNIISYFALRNFTSASVTASTVISWLLSVLFAYITNKIFVFESKKSRIREVAAEIIAFVSGRLFTGLTELVIMVVFVDALKLNEPLIKIVSNVVVVVLNYIFSKLWIFKK